MNNKEPKPIIEEIRFSKEAEFTLAEYTWKISDWHLIGVGSFFYYHNQKTNVYKPFMGDYIEPKDIKETLAEEYVEKIINEFFKPYIKK